MKKTKIFVLFVLLAFTVMSCSKENDVVSNTVRQEISIQEGISTNAYAQLTNQYLAAVDEDSTPPDLVAPRQFWRNLWGKVKEVLNADGEGASTGASFGPVGSVVVGAVYSLAEIFKQETLDVKKGLSDLKVLDLVKYEPNQFDVMGHNHYIIVNSFLNDIEKYKDIANENELYLAIEKRVRQESKFLFPMMSMNSDLNFIALYEGSKLQPGESYTEGTAYYDRVFSSDGKKADPAFVQISKLYARSYEAVKEGYIDAFIQYSKDMEQAVIDDGNLASTVKEMLLVRMATQRYGIKYYANLK